MNTWTSCTRKSTFSTLTPTRVSSKNASRLWEGSWEDGAKTMTAEKGAYDPTKIHKIHFDGIYYQMSGYAQAHPSPQRTPVIFQAGPSASGKQFAGKHAEAIFYGGTDMKKTRRVRSRSPRHSSRKWASSNRSEFLSYDLPNHRPNIRRSIGQTR